MANLHLTRLVLYDNWPGVPDQKLGYPTRTPSCGTNGKGWDNTVDNFSVVDDTARYLNAQPPSGGKTRIPIGQKRQLYHDSTDSPGYYTMMYLCYHSFEGRASGSNSLDISKEFSDGNFFCTPATVGCISNSEWADTSRGPYFVVSRCTTGADVTQACAVAVPCSTEIYSDGTAVSSANNGYGDGYGWFWVGGVCPCKDITLLDDETGAGKGVEITVDAGLGRGPVLLCETGAAAWLMACDMTNISDADSSEAIPGASPGSRPIGWACASAA